jgi:hypothetical protein
MSAPSIIPLEVALRSAAAFEAEAFSLTAMGAIKPRLESKALVQGTLPYASLGVFWGKSGVAKTAILLNVGLHIAAGMPLGGRQVANGAVLWVALESRTGMDNRIVAWCREHGQADAELPFYMAETHRLNLRDSKDVARLIATIKAATVLAERPIVLVVIDTLSLALAGGDENGPDMGAAAAGAREVVNATKASVVLIHHSGKDEARGMRGSSSLHAAADFAFEVKKHDSVVEARAIKQRDLPDGEVLQFAITAPEIGRDEYGHAVTSVVAKLVLDAPVRAQQRTAPSGNAAIVLRALAEAVNMGGEPAPPSNHIPARAHGVSVAAWREYSYRALPVENAEAKRKAFNRACTALVANQYVGLQNDFAWVVG